MVALVTVIVVFHSLFAKNSSEAYKHLQVPTMQRKSGIQIYMYQHMNTIKSLHTLDVNRHSSRCECDASQCIQQVVSQL